MAEEKNPNNERYGWPDGALLHHQDYECIFRVISASSVCGMAVTDSNGNIAFCNKLFSPSILTRLSQEGRLADTSTTEFIIPSDTGNNILKRSKLNGDQYFWLLTPVHNEIAQPNISANDIAFTLIIRTSSDDKLVFTNNLFRESLQIEDISQVTDVASLFEHPEDYSRMKERALAERKVLNETIHFRRKDGQRLYGLINCQTQTDEYGREVIDWSILDISTQVEHERSLEQKNEQLAKVNGQMERFLYSTSHDLRSPLTSILGLVNLLKAETKEKNLLEYVSKIENCTLKLDNIIKDIMSFSRTNYQRIRSVKIELEPLIWKIINSYSIFPDFGKIFFEVKTTGNALFYSDRDRIEIILNNLIRNSIAFFDHHKVKPFVRINVNSGPGELMLEIIDNGIGIPVQHQPNVFNMFYKASERSRGTGLGLYIVRESIQQLKGRIRLESEVGFGTVFRCTIPNDTKGKLINRKIKLQHNA